MGIFDSLAGLGKRLGVTGRPGLESPNQSSQLTKVLYAEYFVGELGEVSRESALQIPAIKKARNTLAGIIMKLPLVEFEGSTIIDQPWLYRTTSDISPQHRLVAMFDDLFFYDWTCLAVKRNPWTGQLIDAVRIPWERWSVNPDGQVLVDFQPVPANQVVLIPGIGDGGVLGSANTIKGAIAIERAWIGRAQNPIPLVELHQLTDDEIEDDEVDDLLADWSAARTSPTGAVGWTDHRVEVRVHGTVSTDLFEQGRNAMVLDAARITGVPASILDGSQSTASLTYSTTEGKRNEFDDYSLPRFLAPIEARLSMDDVSRTGRVIRFDLSSRNAPAAPAITQPTKD